jgi:hypothetical protein
MSVEIINNFLTQLVESILDHQGVRVAILMMLIAPGQVWSSNEQGAGSILGREVGVVLEIGWFWIVIGSRKVDLKGWWRSIWISVPKIPDPWGRSL